jgi:hypothetical protein
MPACCRHARSELSVNKLLNPAPESGLRVVHSARPRPLPAGEASLAQAGAGEGIRTPDPLITNQMLYQLSYASGYKPIILLARPINCKGSH